MSIFPEWAANIHPLVIHFPIALLFVAVMVDAVSLVLKERPFWQGSAVLLYVAGGLGVVAAWLSGQQAAESVFLPTEAIPFLAEHSSLGQLTLYLLGGYALVRFALHFIPFGKKPIVRLGMFVLALAGLVLVYSNTQQGTRLVYRFGVGVDVIDHSPMTMAAPTDSTARATSAPIPDSDGGWQWKPTRAGVWRTAMQFMGDGTVSSAMVDAGDHGDVLQLTADAGPVMLVFDAPLDDLQIDVSINLDRFDGVFMLVHHVVDEANYQFTSIGNQEMRLGRSENGDIYLIDAKKYTPSGWQTYRVVSDGSRARAYAGEGLLTHGYGPTPDAGPVGIRLNGTGSVLLDFMNVVALRPVPSIEKPQ